MSRITKRPQNMASAISHHRSSDGIDCSSSSVQKQGGRIITKPPHCHKHLFQVEKESLHYILQESTPHSHHTIQSTNNQITSHSHKIDYQVVVQCC